jgi:hypothetical protein
MANITTAQAAEELGVTRGRVIQLCNQGRVEGAERIGRDWIIPTPVKVSPGTRGPRGIAQENRKTRQSSA